MSAVHEERARAKERIFSVRAVNHRWDPKAQHEETYVVVGVLEPSNTPADRVLWIPLAGLQNMSGHAAATASDVSAVLVKLRTPIAGQQLDMLYNRQGTRLTWAWPIAIESVALLCNLDLVGQVENAVRHSFTNLDVRDLGDDIVRALKMLHIHG